MMAAPEQGVVARNQMSAQTQKGQRTSPSRFLSFKSSAYFWDNGAAALEDVMSVVAWGTAPDCEVVLM
jgi:hypothetical protein